MRQSILSLLFFLLTNMLYSQLPPQGNVSTPKGSPVTAYITPEMSNAERAYWDANYSSPNRNYIYYFNDGYSSSFRFNCHGYAWNMSEGGPVRWIGFEYTTDEDIYMTDGSYIQVCNEIYPGKVSWIGGDHSAVTTSTPGRWTSKWNKYPLMTHYKDDTPFGINYAYYASTMVNGSTASLCSGTRIFSVQNIPGATYTWTYSSTLSVAGATNASQLTVQQNGSSNGAAWVQVQISTPCSSTTVTNRKDFIVGLPPLSVTSYVDRTPQASNYQYLTATATQLAGTVPSDYKWYKEEANNVRGALLATGLQLIQYPIPPCTTIYYQCVATTSCGEIVYRG